MAFRISGFGADAREKKEMVSTYQEDPRTIVPRKSLVQVRFPGKGMALTYFNDLFDLKVGDRVYVDGKLERQLGHVVDVSYNFKIKISDYKKIIAVVFGLDDSTTDLGGPSLEDIGDPNVVSKQHYLGYCNKMARSYEYLLKMISNPYPFIYDVVSSQDQYYWLPSEHLPL